MVGFQRVEMGENVILENGNSEGEGAECIMCEVPSVNDGHNYSIRCIETGDQGEIRFDI